MSRSAPRRIGRSPIWRIRREAAPGATAELRFIGELFEMEDQRYWTEASFRSYCTALRLPYPVPVAEGADQADGDLRLLGRI